MLTTLLRSAVIVLPVATVVGAQSNAASGPGDQMLTLYFKAEAARLANRGLADVKTREQWESRREACRAQLREMLGLDPLPERTELRTTVTGRTPGNGFHVEKLHFQSRPGLYVTANLYVPAGLAEPAPAVLYLCGHNRDNPRFGNKVGYHHHAVWFARHGYVCLVLDTLQLGEITGVHDGAHRKDRFWWYTRGYTPAGVETWNALRAIDLLETRAEVDPQRIGVTGRSGGGGYTWYAAALDDRIKVAAPISGMTDVEAQVAENLTGRHCDCMFLLNTYRWDFGTVAALIAPRPLLLGNGDRESSYPLAGVTRFQSRIRRMYELHGKKENFAFVVGPGDHEDSQELQLAAFRWFNRHLKGDTAPIQEAAAKQFTPAQLKVFATLPVDELNTRIDELFVPAADPKLPRSSEEWALLRDGWRAALAEKSFQGWPSAGEPLDVRTIRSEQRDGWRTDELEFTSQGPVRLRLTVLRPATGTTIGRVVLTVVDEPEWTRLDAMIASTLNTAAGGSVYVWLAPRGVGPTRWDQTRPNPTQVKRRFMLLGQTLEAMQVWDVRRAVQAIRSVPSNDLPMALNGKGTMAGIALYASLFEPRIAGLDLENLPVTHRDGPVFLNVARYLDMPQAVAMAAERSPVRLRSTNPEAWRFARATADGLGWGQNLQLEPAIASVEVR